MSATAYLKPLPKGSKPTAAQIVFTGSSSFRNAGWSLTGNEDDPGAWAAWVTGGGNVTGALQFLFQDTTVKNYLARDPAANSLTYAPWDQNQNALYAMAALNDPTNTDIRPFINSDGKLILWHGANDAALSVNSTAEYVANMRTAVGAANADAATRFYVAPRGEPLRWRPRRRHSGPAHCPG